MLQLPAVVTWLTAVTVNELVRSGGKLRPGGSWCFGRGPCSCLPPLIESSAPDLPDAVAPPPVVCLLAAAADASVNPTEPEGGERR